MLAHDFWEKREAGFSLTGALVAAGLLGVLAVGVASLFESQNRQMLVLRTQLSRDQLKSSLDRYIQNSSFVERSGKDYSGPNSTANRILYFCLNGKNPDGSTTPCPGGGAPPNCCIGAGAYQAFYLLDPSQVLSSTATFSGTDADPKRYDVDGAPCPSSVTTGTTRCPIEVVTQFRPSCASGPDCSKANQIDIRYEIRKASTLTDGAPLKPISVSRSLGGGGGSASPGVSCPAGHVLTDVNADGSLVCANLGHYRCYEVSVETSGQCAVGGQFMMRIDRLSCTDGCLATCCSLLASGVQVVTGVNPDGSLIRMSFGHYDCENISVATSGQCPAPKFMTKFDRQSCPGGVCTATCCSPLPLGARVVTGFDLTGSPIYADLGHNNCANTTMGTSARCWSLDQYIKKVDRSGCPGPCTATCCSVFP